ncbi:MAG TPA: hypothetical protein VMA75_03110 [Candidatus Paceibacterota bacterium]|nr:hypothetical protein [Candidatus Paceibacterota bacterium]
MSNFLSSKNVRAVLIILGSLIILFVAFGLGIAVGYERAGFAAGLDKNYYRIFYGASPGGPLGSMTSVMPVPGPGPIHGVVGTVIDLGTSTISVRDGDGDEQSVAVPTGTSIRQGEGTVVIGNVSVGDQIAVIGEPDADGQIVARFIRIIPVSSTTNQ